MIARVEGKLVEKGTNYVVVMAGGIGLLIHIPLSTYLALPDSGTDVTLFTHTVIKDSAMELYGFKSLEERELFKVIISVTGIGSRLGLVILSGIEPHDLIDAIVRGDSMRLKRIPGIGKRLAERIIFELKEKVLKLRPEIGPSTQAKETQGVLLEAISALVNLGYPENTAISVVKKASNEAEDLEGIIRTSLRLLAKAQA